MERGPGTETQGAVGRNLGAQLIGGGLGPGPLFIMVNIFASRVINRQSIRNQQAICNRSDIISNMLNTLLFFFVQAGFA